MKIILQNRTTSIHAIAGDSIQIRKTGEYLRKLGVEVKIDFSLGPDLSQYDLVHLFNLIPIEDTYRQLLNSEKYHKKTVLSTVYWDPTEYLQHHANYPDFISWWERTLPLRAEILSKVDLILPNSLLELQVLKDTFSNIPTAVVIPNAADLSFINANPSRFIHRFGIKDFVLSVGRVSPRKNQLAIIRAVKRLKLPLVLVGPLNDGLYYQECRKEASGTECLFIDTLDHLELASAYAAARVHILASWYDTPGLVSLEAALAGCSIVSTDRGSAGEYFKDLAFYCQPDDLDSICQALSQAWHSPANPKLKEMVATNYTWEKVARQTRDAYLKLNVGN